jgi:protein-S-isoprenylcysteine O-methyltransferase Ste14
VGREPQPTSRLVPDGAPRDAQLRVLLLPGAEPIRARASVLSPRLGRALRQPRLRLSLSDTKPEGSDRVLQHHDRGDGLALISDLGTHFTLDWFTDPRFIIGITLYYGSFVLNIRSDAIIRNLRSVEEIERGDKVYRIPRGGLFRFVTNPSYLTEITAFTGFAIATWSLGATFILLITIANLVPRAFQTHRWYEEKFPDYPRERRVLIPFVL